MVAAQQQDAPQLVVTKPEPLRGTVYSITGDYVTVGRREGCELRLDEDAVSRRHAALRRSNGETVVSDLGSSNGTSVNGNPVGEVGRPLRDGDMILIGSVEMRFQTPGNDVTQATRVVRPDLAHQVHFSAQTQTADQLNNVGRDQHNAYIQQVQARDSFARDIASTKTKARRLIWAGLAAYVLGGATYAWVIFRGVALVQDLAATDSQTPPQMPQLLGPQIGGIPVGLIGFACAAIGTLLMVVGIVLHVVAASRRRRLQDQAFPAPWQFTPPPAQQGW